MLGHIYPSCDQNAASGSERFDLLGFSNIYKILLEFLLPPGSFILASANTGMDTEYISEIEGYHKTDSHTSPHDGVLHEWQLTHSLP